MASSSQGAHDVGGLKACPFCNEPPDGITFVAPENEGDGWYVWCEAGCGAMSGVLRYQDGSP